MATNQTGGANAQTATSPKKSSGRGWFWLLLLVVVIGGGGVYVANTMPQIIGEKLGWHKTNDNADNTIEIATEDAADVVIVDDENDTAVQLADINRRLDNIEQQLDRQQWRQLQNRLLQTERRLDDISENGSGQSIQLIDIALQATGNAAAAAAALESLSAAAETESRKQFMLAEAARLKNAPDRKHITAAINKLRALVQQIADIPADAETPQNPAAKLVFSLLKVRKITSAQKRAEGLDDALARMELLITTGQHDLYLAELSAAAAQWQKAQAESDDSDIARLFAQLQDMGAPQYRLGTGV